MIFLYLTGKKGWRVLKKLEIKLPYDPTIPLIGIYPERIIVQKVTHIPKFIKHYLQ